MGRTNRAHIVSLMVWLLISSLAVACRGTQVDSVVSGVSPVVVESGSSMDITISGLFVTQVTVSALTGEIQETKDFSGRLVLEDPADPLVPAGGAYPLQNVIMQDATTLHARTSGELVAGVYRIEVTDPRGMAATVDQDVRLTATDVWPDHVQLITTTRYLSAGDNLTVGMQLVTLDGAPFAAPANVTLSLSSPNASFVSWELIEGEWQQVGEHEQVVGGLDENGSGSITVTNETVELFEIFVSSEGLPHAQPDGNLQIIVVPGDLEGFEVSFDGQNDAEPVHRVVAGQSFDVQVRAVDNRGALVDLDTTFQLVDCSYSSVYQFQSDPELIDGAWSGSLRYNLVTGQQCFLLAVGPDQTYGFSKPFLVDPGPAAILAVVPTFSQSIEAGQAFDVNLTQRDGLGNLAPFSSAQSIQLEDDVGPVSCSSVEVDGAFALARGCWLTKAQAVTHLRAVGDDQATGMSEAFEVRHGPATGLGVELVDGLVVTAGADFYVSVWAQDFFGNLADDVNAEGSLVATDSEGDDHWNSPVPFTLAAGEASVIIKLTRATPDTYLVGVVPPGEGRGELTGDSLWFEVQPAEAHHFSVAVRPSYLTAGDVASVEIQVLDAYENLVPAYLPSGFELSDTQGLMVPDDFTVGPFEEGRAQATFQPTVATAENAIVAQDAYSLRGVSNAFSVGAGGASRILVVNQKTAYWLEEPFGLTLEAVDSYDNLVPSFAGNITLDDLTGTLRREGASAEGEGALPIGPFVNGQYTGRFVLGMAARVNAFAFDGDLVGKSAAFPVYRRDCATAPDASLLLNGEPDSTVVCLPRLLGQPASVSFEAQATSEVSIIDYVWDFGDGNGLRGLPESHPSHAYSAAGRYRVEMAVVDSELCASTHVGVVYVGTDDGSPAGPMQVTISPSVLNAGEATQGQVTVSAYDCQGDPASGANQVTGVTSLGELLTPRGDANAQAPGLQFLMDLRTGQLNIPLSVEKERQAGTARVVMVFGGGIAEGHGAVTVSNDQLPPFVVDYEPRGSTSGLVSEVNIWFNEAMRGGSALTKPQIEVYSSRQERSLPLAGRSLLEDGRRLQLLLAEPLDLNSRPDDLRVTLPSAKDETTASLTDLVGNRLDGNWDGQALAAGDPFVFRFGNLQLEPSSGGALNCAAAPITFSPDGQDGANAEADLTFVEAMLHADAGGRAYRVEIQDAWEQPVAWLWGSLSLEETVFDARLGWPGRAADGQVLANGYYWWTVQVVDARDNWLSATCSGSVEINNFVDLGDYP